MKKFFKYFSIGLVVQIVVVTTTVLLGLGDLILMPYWIPYEILGAIITLPKQIDEGMISLIILLCLPAIIYAIIFGLVMCAIKKSKKDFR